jgi:hypothetical protein
MVKVFNNAISEKDTQLLVDYFFQQDELVDDRLDVCSKCPDWKSNTWPKSCITPILDKFLDAYQVEEVLFLGSKISFNLHVDSDTGDLDKLYKVILIPLSWEGNAATVFFNNHWHGSSTRFCRTDASPFRYKLPNCDGVFVEVADVRDLLHQCKTFPNQVTEFDVTDDFVSKLQYIVDVRNSNKTDNRTSDYSQIKNLQVDQKFDADIHAMYLNHINIENLHGLVVDQVVTWEPGQVIVFDRTQLHSAAAGHKFKLGLSIFTNHR